jgi:hypothetical protein
MSLKKFEEFMLSEEFIDFHEYFICSRNNKYKFKKNKFDITVEYFKHLKKVKILKKDLKDFEVIFIKHDIAIVPKEQPIFNFYTYNDKMNETELNENVKYNSDTSPSLSDDEYNSYISYSINISKNLGIPYMFKRINNYLYNNEEDHEVDIEYEYDTLDINESDNSEIDEL